MLLANLLRHEIEHLTQSGYNTLPGKYLPDDQHLRRNASTVEYLTLDKEVPAAVQGISLQAKKEKRNFYDVLVEYLSRSYLLESDARHVTKKYILKAEELNLWKLTPLRYKR